MHVEEKIAETEFQFHKVRLKDLCGFGRVIYDSRFNSIRYD